MGEFLVCLITALVAGILMAVQGTINGQVGKIIGVMEGNFLVHVIGLILIAVLLFVFGLGKGDWSKMAEVPWYGYLGGIINVAIIYGVMFSIPKIGASAATTAIIVGQVSTAMVLDWLGLFGLEKTGFCGWQLLGLALLAIGGKLMLVK